MTATLQRFSQPFDTAWYTGAAVSGESEVPNKFQVSLAGHNYLVDLTQYQRSTLPIRRQPMDDSIEPGEQSLSQEGVWRRSVDNMFLGAGQEYLDNRFTFLAVYMRNGENPSIRSRFWHSQGVDPWTEGSLQLLPEQHMVKTSTAGAWVIEVGGYLYYWDGAALQYCANPGTGTLSWTVVTAPSGGWPATVTSPTTDGFNLWMCGGTSGLLHTTKAAAAATVVRPQPAAPTVVPTGAAATTYIYFIVGTDANGFKTLVSPSTTITNGNATPNNTISWVAIPGIVNWDVLRGDTSHSVALGVTGTSFVDTVVSPTAGYTAPTATTLNFQPDFLGYANGFLVGAEGPLLTSVPVNGTTLLLWTHPNPNFKWKCSGPSPMAIYLAGDAGAGKSEIYATTLDSTTLGLSAPYLAGQVGNGEIVNVMSYYEGLMIIGTSLGVRTAQDTQANGHLTTGPIITAPGSVQCLAPYSQFCWFGWSNYNTADGVHDSPDITSGTGRLSLSTYTTNPLLPAYAADVSATLGTTGTTTSVVVINGNVFFTLSSTGGLWGPDGNVVSTGFMESGWVRYGMLQAKVLVGADMKHDPLQGTVSFEVFPDGGQMTLIGTSTDQGSTGPSQPFAANNLKTQSFQVVLTLDRDATDATKGPVVHSWTTLALPVVTRQDQIIVPIMMGQTAMSPVRDGEVFAYDPLAEFQYLKGLESTCSPVRYQEGAQGYTVTIDQIEVKPKKWTDDFRGLEGLLLVKLLTLDLDG